MSQEIKILKYEDGQLAYYMEHRHLVEEKVLQALTWLAEHAAVQGYKDIIEPSELVEYVLDEFYLVKVSDTLVAFSLAEPWFMRGRVVCEEFIVPLTDAPSPIADVVKALEAVGRSCGCTTLTLGTRANPKHRGLARMFEREGARISTIELIKEIPS